MDRLLRRIMTRCLPRGLDLSRYRQSVGRGDFGQIFFTHRALTQDFYFIRINSNDCRLETDNGRTRIQYQGNPTTQLLENMLRASRADTSEPVRTWRRQGLSESTKNLKENRMPRHSNCHLLKPGRYEVRPQIGFGEKDC